jgi:predicted RNA-binding Zn ribbon-like protein
VKFIAGRLCLDFVNTVGGRTEIVLRDKLNDYGDLVRFGQLSGSLPAAGARRLARKAANDSGKAAAVLARAKELREALYRIFRSSIDARRPAGSDLATLGGELLIARSHERLAISTATYIWTWDDEAAPDRVLWPVARSAADLLTSSDLAALRQCAGDRCGWLFLDSSRNHRRRWCDMKDCGNRAKVQRYRSGLTR